MTAAVLVASEYREYVLFLLFRNALPRILYCLFQSFTVDSDTPQSRAVSLIGFPCSWYVNACIISSGVW